MKKISVEDLVNIQLVLGIGFLIFAFRTDLSYDYFSFLRAYVCFACLGAQYKLYVLRSERLLIPILLIISLLLFNPFFPDSVDLSKPIWIGLDMMVASLFALVVDDK